MGQGHPFDGSAETDRDKDMLGWDTAAAHPIPGGVHHLSPWKTRGYPAPAATCRNAASISVRSTFPTPVSGISPTSTMCLGCA